MRTVVQRLNSKEICHDRYCITSKEEKVSGCGFLGSVLRADTMVTKMLYKREDNVPFHKHPNEQSGYVISGRYRIQFENWNQEIGPGDSYSIPQSIEHRIEILEPGEVVDFFSPPRKDHL